MDMEMAMTITWHESTSVWTVLYGVVDEGPRGESNGSIRICAPEQVARDLRQRFEDPTVLEDFQKCYDLAMVASSYWAEVGPVWEGTVSERLGKLFRIEHEAREEAEARVAELQKLLDRIEQRMSEGQGIRPWCSCATDLAIVQEERARLDAAQERTSTKSNYRVCEAQEETK